MFKFFTCLIFSLMTLASPLVNLGVNLHMALDHENHVEGHQENSEINHHRHSDFAHKVERLFIDLAYHTEGSPSEHHEHLQSSHDTVFFSVITYKLSSIKALPYFVVGTDSLEIKRNSYFYKIWPAIDDQSYTPNPYQFRNRPLLI